MSCRDCIHHNACADIADTFLISRHPNWRNEWYLTCEEFDEVSNEPTKDVEAPTNNSEDTAAADPTMDDVGALLINLYAEYSQMVGYTDDDYAKAVCIAVRMLSD